MTPFLQTLQTLLAFLFALGVIIVVHEAGHLLVAKAFNVRVLTFSVGFGKRLWSIQRGETEYRVALVPLGGYVRLSGENPDEASADPRDFLNKPRWQRILVYLAGPAMNVVLSVLIFAGLFMIGMDLPHLPDLAPVVGSVAPGSPAEKAGLQTGDLIRRADGKEVKSWQQLFMTLVTSPDRAVQLDVEREGKSFSAAVKPARDPQTESGDLAGIRPPLRPQVTLVTAGGPAEAGGFRIEADLEDIRRLKKKVEELEGLLEGPGGRRGGGRDRRALRAARTLDPDHTEHRHQPVSA